MIENDHDSLKASFSEWLEEHGYCKVTPCCRCQYWQGLKPGRARDYIIGECQYHRMQKYADDYCIDARERTGDEI